VLGINTEKKEADADGEKKDDEKKDEDKEEKEEK